MKALRDLWSLIRILLKDIVDVGLIVLFILGLVFTDGTKEHYVLGYVFIGVLMLLALLRMAWFKRQYHELLNKFRDELK